MSFKLFDKIQKCRLADSKIQELFRGPSGMEDFFNELPISKKKFQKVSQAIFFSYHKHICLFAIVFF